MLERIKRSPRSDSASRALDDDSISARRPEARDRVRLHAIPQRVGEWNAYENRRRLVCRRSEPPSEPSLTGASLRAFFVCAPNA